LLGGGVFSVEGKLGGDGSLGLVRVKGAGLFAVLEQERQSKALRLKGRGRLNKLAGCNGAPTEGARAFGTLKGARGGGGFQVYGRSEDWGRDGKKGR